MHRLEEGLRNGLRDEEVGVLADAGHQGAALWTRAKVRWQIAIRPGKRRAQDTGPEKSRLIDESKRVMARIRAKGAPSFRAIRRPFGFTKVSYRDSPTTRPSGRRCSYGGNLWVLRERPPLGRA